MDGTSAAAARSIRTAGVLEGQSGARRAKRPPSSDIISHSFVLEAPKTARMRASNKAFISARRLYTVFVNVREITGFVSLALFVFPEMQIVALRCCPSARAPTQLSCAPT